MTFIHYVEYKSRDQAIADTLESIRQHKVTVLRGVDKGIELDPFYTQLSDQIGEVILADEDLMSGQQTGNRWIEISFDPDIQDRYRTAKVHQPLHTDASYLHHEDGMTFFFCRAKARKGGATVFLDSEELVSALLDDGQDYLYERLRCLDVCFSKAGNSITRPIVTEDEKGLNLNYNYYCLDAGNSDEVKEMVEEFQVFLEQRIRNAGLPHAVILEPGEAVFFHDYRLLHGRNAYFAKDKNERCLVKGVVLPFGRVC
ncbi:MAG: TauD/TfdA family dioxygenase [Pseudomonadales bacterium]|nr:TauD/TfdA family dioxygenase [Pseudomonadales bacterium]